MSKPSASQPPDETPEARIRRRIKALRDVERGLMVAIGDTRAQIAELYELLGEKAPQTRARTPARRSAVERNRIKWIVRILELNDGHAKMAEIHQELVRVLGPESAGVLETTQSALRRNPHVFWLAGHGIYKLVSHLTAEEKSRYESDLERSRSTQNHRASQAARDAGVGPLAGAPPAAG